MALQSGKQRSCFHKYLCRVESFTVRVSYIVDTLLVAGCLCVVVSAKKTASRRMNTQKSYQHKPQIAKTTVYLCQTSILGK